MRNALERYLVDGHFSIRSEEIGQLVADVFRDVRAELQREISGQMARESRYPRSGPVSIGSMTGASLSIPNGLPQGLDQPASMSGISVSRTASSVYATPSAPVGTLLAERPTGLRLQSVVVGAVVAVSVAIVFALVERSRTAPAVLQTAPPTAAAALPATAHDAPPPSPVDPSPADPSRVEASPPAPGAIHSVQAPPVWRPARPQWEPRQTTAPRAATPSPGAAPSAPQNSGPAAPPAEPPVVHAAAAPAPTPTPPSPPAAGTQEGRKFRTSL